MREPVILFTNGGGIGDKICAEPVFRYAIEKVFIHSDKIIIATDFPLFYTHLETYKNVEVKTIAEINKDPTPYRSYTVRRILVGPETMVQGIVHQTMHPVDYISLVCLQMMLPHEARQIRLPAPMKDELAEIKDKLLSLHKLDLSRTILIHPGKTWPTRTIPLPWWAEFCQHLQKMGIDHCIVGKHSFSNKPSILDIPGAPSLVDKLSLRELIVAISACKGVVTNESMPVYIAGAFNTSLWVFSTFKEWENMRPYHQDNCYNLATKTVFPPSWHRPTQTVVQSDLLPNGATIKDIIKTPTEASQFISNTM